jgi:hypothetical protein
MEAVQAIYQGVNLATRSAAVPTATTGG